MEVAGAVARVVCVGDLMFDRRLAPPRMFFYYPDAVACYTNAEQQFRLPFVNDAASHQWFRQRQHDLSGIGDTSHAPISRAVDDGEDDPDHPFRAVAPAFAAADMVFGNLECPLSSRGRRMSNDCCYSASPAFAPAMAKAGFRAVSFANNHAMDFGVEAFTDTLDALEGAGIRAAGAGRTLAEARRPAIVPLPGLTVGFLAYSMIGSDWIYAAGDECGVAPLNPMIVSEDIAAARPLVDFLFVSLHWGVEGTTQIHPRCRDIAFDILDCGADAVIGHHPHVPSGIELHGGRPIIYSLGNFCFGHDHPTWRKDMYAAFEFNGPRLERLVVVPIGGRYQPKPLGDDACRALANLLQRTSGEVAERLSIEPGQVAIAL